MTATSTPETAPIYGLSLDSIDAIDILRVEIDVVARLVDQSSTITEFGFGGLAALIDRWARALGDVSAVETARAMALRAGGAA